MEKEEDVQGENRLKSLLVLEDGAVAVGELRRVGGLDVAYAKGRDGIGDMALACLVVLSLPSLERCYTDSIPFKIEAPYAPGFLAQREGPALIRLLDRAKERQKEGEVEAVPDIVLVDGNGIMHPRRFGIACYVGVAADIPAVGVSKNFLALDDLDMYSSKEAVLSRLAPKAEENCSTSAAFNSQCLIRCTDGEAVGCAVTAPASRTPVYVSPGHKVSLESSISIVRRTQVYRIPEPIRHADAEARAALRRYLAGSVGLDL